MYAAILWPRLIALIEPHYHPKACKGRPHTWERMLGIFHAELVQPVGSIGIGSLYDDATHCRD
jgi:hypothetical protein